MGNTPGGGLGCVISCWYLVADTVTGGSLRQVYYKNNAEAISTVEELLVMSLFQTFLFCALNSNEILLV